MAAVTSCENAHGGGTIYCHAFLLALQLIDLKQVTKQTKNEWGLLAGSKN